MSPTSASRRVASPRLVGNFFESMRRKHARSRREVQMLVRRGRSRRHGGVLWQAKHELEGAVTRLRIARELDRDIPAALAQKAAYRVHADAAAGNVRQLARGRHAMVENRLCHVPI